MSFAEYATYDGLGLADLVRRRQVSPAELVEAAIERIEKHNPALNAVVFKAYDEARAQAAAPADGPFAGVPFLLKDIGGLRRGWPTRQAAAITPDTPSDRNGTLVDRYEAAGVILLGKTNTPEFGIVAVTEPTLYGPARNPWNPAHSPGGSSGGAGAAVAAGMVPVAHGGDGGGSIRIPASCCGLVGLKPTRARTPNGPQIGDVMGGLVIDHVLSRTVRDSAAMLDATAGPDLGDPYWAPPQPASYLDILQAAPRRLRVGFGLHDLTGRALHPECVEAVRKTAALLEAMGHIVEEASPDVDLDAVNGAFNPIWGAGHAMLMQQAAAATLGRELRPDDVAPIPWQVYEAGLRVSGIEYLEAWATLHAESRKIALWQQTYDVWLTSTLGFPPVEVGEYATSFASSRTGLSMGQYVPFTPLQNMTGQPAISLPLHWSADGLPVGVHFAGRFGEDDVLLQLAARLEEAAPWKDRRPPLWG